MAQVVENLPNKHKTPEFKPPGKKKNIKKQNNNKGKNPIPHLQKNPKSKATEC
jgi:hypothetical protein